MRYGIIANQTTIYNSKESEWRGCKQTVGYDMGFNKTTQHIQIGTQVVMNKMDILQREPT